MKIQITIVVTVIFLTSSALAMAGNSGGYFHIPIGIRHFTHLMLPPKDLYEHIVNDEFLFWEAGFSKNYSLNPKYLDFYELGLYSPIDNLPSSFRLKGIIKAQFFFKDELLFEKEIGHQIAVIYIEGDMGHYKNVSLLNFEIPLLGKYKDDVSVVLTVLKPDVNLKKYARSVKIYIAVSAIP